MINYKQWNSYWNNFINGDEALFQDASLQRDEFWFQIRPWINTRENKTETSANTRAIKSPFYQVAKYRKPTN